MPGIANIESRFNIRGEMRLPWSVHLDGDDTVYHLLETEGHASVQSLHSLKYKICGLELNFWQSCNLGTAGWKNIVEHRKSYRMVVES